MPLNKEKLDSDEEYTPNDKEEVLSPEKADTHSTIKKHKRKLAVHNPNHIPEVLKRTRYIIDQTFNGIIPEKLNSKISIIVGEDYKDTKQLKQNLYSFLSKNHRKNVQVYSSPDFQCIILDDNALLKHSKIGNYGLQPTNELLSNNTQLLEKIKAHLCFKKSGLTSINSKKNLTLSVKLKELIDKINNTLPSDNEEISVDDLKIDCAKALTILSNPEEQPAVISNVQNDTTNSEELDLSNYSLSNKDKKISSALPHLIQYKRYLIDPLTTLNIDENFKGKISITICATEQEAKNLSNTFKTQLKKINLEPSCVFYHSSTLSCVIFQEEKFRKFYKNYDLINPINISTEKGLETLLKQHLDYCQNSNSKKPLKVIQTLKSKIKSFNKFENEQISHKDYINNNSSVIGIDIDPAVNPIKPQDKEIEDKNFKIFDLKNLSDGELNFLKKQLDEEVKARSKRKSADEVFEEMSIKKIKTSNDSDLNLKENQEITNNFYNSLVNNINDFFNNSNLSTTIKKFENLQLIAQNNPVSYVPQFSKNSKTIKEQNSSGTTELYDYRLKKRSSATKPSFDFPVMPNGMLPVQFGASRDIPLIKTPTDGKYIIERNEIYNNFYERKKFTEKYYLPHVDSNPEVAADALLYLFEHIVKQSIIEKHSFKKPFIIYIEKELNKIGIEDCINSKVEKLIKARLNKITIKYSKFFPKEENLFHKPKLDEREKIEIRFIKISKSKNIINPNTQIDDIPHDYQVFGEEDLDIYDNDTNELICSLRKNSVKKETIEQANKYIFSTEKKIIQAKGARRADDSNNIDNTNDKTIPLSAPIGFLGSQRTSSIVPTNFLTEHDNGKEILEISTDLACQMEEKYKQIAPKEFEHCKEKALKIKPFLFDGCDTLATIDYNFDKQTKLHIDSNEFPGRSYGIMTVFYGSEMKRYKGGYTMFPEYKLAIDVSQGDLLIADFNNLYHCNSKIEKLDTREGFAYQYSSKRHEKFIDVYTRVSAVGFTRGELLMYKQPAIENSDDENEQDIDQNNNIRKPIVKEEIKSFVEYVRDSYKVGHENNNKNNMSKKRAEEQAIDSYNKRNSFTNMIEEKRAVQQTSKEKS